MRYFCLCCLFVCFFPDLSLVDHPGRGLQLVAAHLTAPPRDHDFPPLHATIRVRNCLHRRQFPLSKGIISFRNFSKCKSNIIFEKYWKTFRCKIILVKLTKNLFFSKNHTNFKVYNDKQIWTFDFSISKATMWFVWDHKRFFTVIFVSSFKEGIILAEKLE